MAPYLDAQPVWSAGFHFTVGLPGLVRPHADRPKAGEDRTRKERFQSGSFPFRGEVSRLFLPVTDCIVTPRQGGVKEALSLRVQTDTISMRAGRIRLMSRPGHPPSDPLTTTPCLRFDDNLFSALHRRLLVLLHTPSFMGRGTNSSHPPRFKGLGDLVWEEAPAATWCIASRAQTEGLVVP
jgi:hypothetical protein